MEILVLLAVAAVFLVIGVPVGISLSLGMLSVATFFGTLSLKFISQAMYSGLESLPLIAVPCFMLAGSIMETGGLSKRIVNVAKKLTGHTSGGLGTVTVISCLFFGAISGSAPATTAAIGSIMIPYMVKANYDKSYGAALTAVSGSLGVIIPPSIPFVIFALSTNSSISDLFLAGIIPGFIIASVLILIHSIMVKKNGYVNNEKKATMKEIWDAIWDAKWALLMPVIILGGIYSGVFTPTEASVVSIVYGIIVGVFVYKELKLKDVLTIFDKNNSFVGGFMLTFAPAAALGSSLIIMGLTGTLSSLLLSITSNMYIILAIVIVFLLFLGMILDTTSSLVVFAPILYAVLQPMGINNIHLGIIMVVTLAVGFITPPVCMNIFIASIVADEPMEAIVKKALPFLIGMIGLCFLFAYVPQISLIFLR